jgi:hypothetical protein
MSGFDDVAERLDAIAEELGERAIELLQTAIRDGEIRRPDDEKRVTQARRAVEKAAHLLRGFTPE